MIHNHHDYDLVKEFELISAVAGCLAVFFLSVRSNSFSSTHLRSLPRDGGIRLRRSTR